MVTTKFVRGNEVIGYRVQYGSGYYFEKNVDNIPDNIDVVQLCDTITPNISKRKSNCEILDKLAIGTPLRINGICEGMDGQQLVYVGKVIDRNPRMTNYLFFDGQCSPHDSPAAFGYFGPQMEYDGVTLIFDENNENEVKELWEDYCFMSSVCELP